MFHSVKEFLEIWHYESESTLRMLRLLTDASLKQTVGDGRRTLGRLANHIVETITELPHRMGVPVKKEPAAYGTAGEIASAYEQVNEQFIEAVQQSLTDADLEQETNMYGEMWKKGHSLFVLVTHQAHHRGQMTVLMRQAGLPVPGVYGPSKEEWEQMNIPPMA